MLKELSTTKDRSRFSPFSILLAVTGESMAAAMAAEAAALVRSLPLPAGSQVSVAGVLPPGRSQDEPALRASMEKARQLISDPGLEVTSHLLQGHPARALVDFAAERQPDLLIIGADRLQATLKVFFGGVAQQVVESADCPVLVVRAPFTGIRRVLLAVDDSPQSQRSAEYLAQFPLPEHTEVHVMHVLPPLPDLQRIGAYLGYSSNPRSVFRAPAELQVDWRQKLAEEMHAQNIVKSSRRTLEAAGLKTKGRVVRGDAAEEILEYARAQEFDMIVAGSRGLSAIKGWWLGSVSRKLIHHAASSTLFVRSTR